MSQNIKNTKTTISFLKEAQQTILSDAQTFDKNIYLTQLAEIHHHYMPILRSNTLSKRKSQQVFNILQTTNALYGILKSFS